MNSLVVFALLVAVSFAAVAQYPAKVGEDLSLGDVHLAGKFTGVTVEKDGKKFTYTKCEKGKPENCDKWVDAAGKVAKGPKVTFAKDEVKVLKLAKSDAGSYSLIGSLNVYEVTIA